MEATGQNPGDRCQLLSHVLPNTGEDKCLYFDFSMKGKHPGTLVVRSHDNTQLWRKVGHIQRSPTVPSPNESMDTWVRDSVTVPNDTTGFIFEASRGGYSLEDDVGDIAIDNLEVENGPCEGTTTIYYSNRFCSFIKSGFVVHNYY